MPVTALPSKAEAENLLPKDSPALVPYDSVVLPAEKAASEASDTDATMRTMFARVVGYLLLYPPSDQARTVVQSEVERCKTERDPNKGIYDLGEMYVKDLILPFYCISEEMTPLQSGDYSLASYERIKEIASQGRLNRPRNTSEAQEFGFARDNYRCMLSHVGDWFAMMPGGIIDPKREPPRGPGRAYALPVECCHIFPEALEVEGGPSDRRVNIAKNHAGAFWAILARFGYEGIHDELRGPNIHRLENVVTLSGGVHALFRGLDVWLEEEDGQANCYSVGVSFPLIYEHFEPQIPERIQFVASDNFPLPNPTYLHIHAACSRIATLSGALKHLNSFYYEESE
ncbi:hypothetical protein LXA43DRAFT_389198 [Ganoderma leucocontextum]|nr:hypothetical protein LXA43DRAFT_389198 [Ganoderma leucocontextum]